MKTLLLVATVAAVSLTAMPAFADNSDEVHGRSKNIVVSELRDNGIAATGVEEWGSYIRAWVSTGSGMILLDADTLRPVSFGNRG